MNKAKECMQSLLQKVFQRFVSLVRKDLMTRAGLNPTSSGNSVEDEDLSREASLVDLDTSAIPLVFPKYDHPNRRPKVAADWKNSLRHIVQKPSSYRDEIFFMNEDFVVIYDGFPKARVHLLLMPRREDVDTISHLRREHLPMLHRLFALSREIAFHLKSQDPSLVLGAGFHAIPSLSLLHCHLISQDMDSPFIRRKSHVRRSSSLLALCVSVYFLFSLEVLGHQTTEFFYLMCSGILSRLTFLSLFQRSWKCCSQRVLWRWTMSR